MTPPNTPDEISIFDNTMLTSKKQQPSTTPMPVTPKTPIYNAKEVSRKHSFSDDSFLKKEIIFLRKELDNKQQIIETLLQQISESVRPIHQVKNTTFNNDVDVTNKYKLIKDCVENANIRFSKEKISKYQSSSKLINDDIMEKSVLRAEKINIQLDGVRKESRSFYQSKEKNGKSVPIETEYPTIENVGSSSIRQWKKGTTLIVGDLMLAGIEEKRISGNRGAKVCIFPVQQITICMTT